MRRRCLEPSARLATVAVIACCLPLVGCYEEPVRDHLHIAFLPGGAIIVTAARDIGPPGSAGDNPAVKERLDQARADLAVGWDRWSRGFAELETLADRTTVERHGGDVVRGVHSALLDDFRPVERLLGLEGLGAFLDRSGDVRELQLVPAGSGQATRQQRELVERWLGDWSADVAAYLGATVQLYRHLERAPGRAVPCFAHVFDHHTDASGPLSEKEAELVAAVKETSERVAEALLIPDGQDHSANELSRLVFDTFHGRLTVAVDGPVLESEGFVEHATFLERPPVGLWLAPDLVTAMVTPGPENAQPDPDPADFAALPRRWFAAPDPAGVEAALRACLTPEPVYRVRWRSRAVPDDDRALEEALAALAAAESNLPD